MASNFQIAFSISVLHTYFEEDTCTCLRFNPGPAIKALSKRFELKQSNRIDGFDFYINTRSSIPDFLAYAGKVTGYSFFDFEIETVEPTFNLFTDLPMGWLGQLVYQSNDNLNTRDGTVIQLHANRVPAASTTNLGTLAIHFEDIIQNGYTQYAINYKARATQWQYFVINTSTVQLENPSISGKIPVSFDGPESVTTRTGQKALLFTSGDNLLPLSELPRYKFDLVNKPARQTGQTLSPKVIFKGLPNPDPRRSGVATVGDDSRVVSPMYIYV
jgi:hypothetical protein